MESLKCFSGVVFSAQVDWSNFASGNVWLCGKFLEYCASGGTRGGGDMKRKKGIMRRRCSRCLKIFCPMKNGWNILVNCQLQCLEAIFPLFVFFLRPALPSKGNTLSHISHNQNCKTFSLQSQVARQLALLTSASAMYFESPVPITGPTPRWLRRAGVP